MSKNVQMVCCLIEKPTYCRVNHTLTHHEVTIRNEETKDIKFTKRQKTKRQKTKDKRQIHQLAF